MSDFIAYVTRIQHSRELCMNHTVTCYEQVSPANIAIQSSCPVQRPAYCDSEQLPPRLLWITPYFVSAGTGHTTTHRVQLFDKYFHNDLRLAGVDVVDVYQVTQSMYEYAPDGLHYIKPGQGSSYVAHFTGFLILNELLS